MDEPIPNFKFLVGVLWVTLLAAIAITLIDMKIKNDILKAAADFYTRMGTEVPDGRPDTAPAVETPDPGGILPLHSVDNAARVEAAILGDKGIETSKERTATRRVQRRAAKNSPGVSEATERPDSDPA